MKINSKKQTAYRVCIYARYALPIISLLATFAMLFLPAHRFIFSGKAGEKISVIKLMLNSWDQSRSVLFGTENTTDAAVIFSRALFIILIVLVLLYLISLAVSVWSAVVAFRFFLSDDDESAERQRRIFCAFIPNRIVLCAITLLGLAVAALPYIMKPLYSLTYSEQVTAILEPPYLDGLIVGGALLLVSIILSVAFAPIERALSADVFEKPKTDDAYEVEDEDLGVDEEIDTSSSENARIRELFAKKADKNDKDVK